MSDYLEEFEKRQREAADQRRKEWFADHRDIPDLDFFPPDCSICWVMTEYDDGYFTCNGCDVSWPQNGYGHQAVRADGSDIARV